MRLCWFLIPYACLALVFWGCELKHNNPLDPENNSSIQVPPQVLNLAASASPHGAAAKFVRLIWSKNLSNTTGYYIYMGMAYNAQFVRVGEQGNISSDPGGQIIIWIKTDMVPGDYYFKVSAYKDFGDDGILEGHLSNWVYIRVPN